MNEINKQELTDAALQSNNYCPTCRGHGELWICGIIDLYPPCYACDGTGIKSNDSRNDMGEDLMDDLSPEELKIKAWNSDYSLYSMLVDSIVGNPGRIPLLPENYNDFKFDDLRNQLLLVVKKINEIDWSLVPAEEELNEIQLIVDELSLNDDQVSKRVAHTLNWSISNHRVSRAVKHCK